MKDRRSPNTIDLSKFFKLITEVVSVRRHVDLMKWLQGDVQQYLPHNILVAAWGDFHLGLIHYDVISALPGVRSENAATDAITPLLIGLFDRWIVQHRCPYALHVGDQGFQWDGDIAHGEITLAMRTMHSALIHGISDQRGRHDCLYVLFSRQPVRHRKERTSLKFLLPYIDNALRQVDLLPHQYPPSLTAQEVVLTDASLGNNPTDSCMLSLRETEIMKWVAMGKTNSEIGIIVNVSTFTVKNHMQRIFKKLNVISRAQAVSAFANMAVPL